jgi:hypothetical protein
VSPTFEFSGSSRFSFLASDSAFRTGANDVRVFVVTGRPARPKLGELRVALS